MVRMITLIIFFASLTFAQVQNPKAYAKNINIGIKSLSEQELKDELTRCLIERLGFKQQAEQTDSLISELQKSYQREWLKDYENKVCSDDKFNLAQKLLNPDCPSPPFYDNFAFGFLSTIFLIILIYGGILIL